MFEFYVPVPGSPDYNWKADMDAEEEFYKEIDRLAALSQDEILKRKTA